MCAHVRVAAVDDHHVTLMGLISVAQAPGLDLTLDLSVVATATTVAELLAEAPEADVVLLDLRLGDGTRPSDNVQRLLGAGYRVLIYSEGDHPLWVKDAVTAGASGVILKSQPIHELLAAIAVVARGDLALSPGLAEALISENALRVQLSPREEQVLRLVGQGLASKQIATVIGISQETVKEYLKRVRQKYEEIGRAAPSRVALHQRAIEDGYVNAD